MDSFNAYQEFTRTTAKYGEACTPPEGVLYCALGIAGEAGEVAEKIKKLLRLHGVSGTFDMLKKEGRERDLIVKELGDILWYVARLADDLGIRLEHVATVNVEKLGDRKDRGVIRSEGDER
jgi:NTP pyrophosphatase (non-canonical NTP hydrolase)